MRINVKHPVPLPAGTPIINNDFLSKKRSPNLREPPFFDGTLLCSNCDPADVDKGENRHKQRDEDVSFVSLSPLSHKCVSLEMKHGNPQNQLRFQIDTG